MVKEKKIVKKTTPKNKECDDIVGLAGAVGGLTVAIAVLVLIFAPEFAWIVIFTTLIMCTFGVLLSRRMNK